MPRNIRWDESVKDNTLYLVEALLRHADDEFKDKKLKALVYVEWLTENQLRVTGKEVKQASGKRSRTNEVGTRKEYLRELVTKTGKSLKFPKLKNEASASLQDRELDEIQTALDCLKELGVREDEKAAKNRGYWKFTLTLKHQTATQEENLDVVRRLWKEHSKTNSPETSHKDLEYEPLGTLSPPENLPRSGIASFTGRKEELERLHQQLQSTHEVVIAAVEGMGGVGKTELAIQYCLLHLQLHTYPGGICWLRAREEDIGWQIVQFARIDLGLHPPEDLELPERVRWCWKRWHEGNTLLVLDDMKNYSDIKPYLPPQPSQFKVVITTRLKLDLAGSLLLEVLREPDALLLLAQLIGEEKKNQELAQAKKLCQRLGYLPLALQLVGRYVNKRKISLVQMLQRLENKGLGHSSLEVNENDSTWTLNVQRGVAAAFELSWLELSDNAKQLGCLLSLFALAPIPWSLVERAAPEQDQEELEDARVELENLHLLASKNTYQLHQLIRQFLRDKQNGLATADEQRYNFCQALVEVAKEFPQSPTQEFIRSVKDAIPHLAELAQNLTDAVSDENLIWVFYGLGIFYTGQGLYALAQPWCEQCVLVLQSRLGEEHPDVASNYNNLAELYRFQGRYTEAEPFYNKALELRQRLLREEHPSVANSYNNLALLYSNQGRYTRAKPLYIKALKLRQRLLGKEHPDVASSYNNLAELYSNQGRYTKAEALYIKALELRQRVLGEEHPNVANSYNNLAELYRFQGRYTEAEVVYIKALELKQRVLGEEHPNVANSYNNLANLYQYQGRYTEAEVLYIKALELTQRLLGEEHPDVASNYNNLANLYQCQGRYTKAELLYIKALELKQRLLGEEHPDVATSYNNLANLYQYQGRYTEAEPLYIKASELTQWLLGEEHPDVASNYNNLAELYRSQGRYTEAEPLLNKALKLRQRLLGEEHPSVAISYNNLAGLYYSQGRYTEAEPLLNKALALRQRLLGEEHPDVAISYNNLAELYRSQGRYTEAEPLYIKASELTQWLLGEEHPDVAISYNNLAALYSNQGSYTKAEPLLNKALALKQRLLGEEHPDVAQSYNNLANLYQSQGRYTEAEPLYKKALQFYEQQLGVGHPTTIAIRKNYADFLHNYANFLKNKP